LATAAALKVRGDGGTTAAEHFLMGDKSRNLAATAPGDARATAEEEDRVEGLVCDGFETTRAFLQN
jgi:hypothetical protein